MYKDALDNLKRAAEIQDKVLDTHEETVRSHQEIAFVSKILGMEKEAMAARSLAERISKELPDTTAKENRTKRLENRSQTEPFDIPPMSE